MTKVLTVGVFDYFHYGHLLLFEQARQYGDFLIVAVQESGSILKYKPNTDMYYTTEQRIHMTESLRTVDRVVTYRDVDTDIQHIDFDVFAVGEDQNHAGFQRAIEWCRTHNKAVVRLHRTPDISSTGIKERVSKLQ